MEENIIQLFSKDKYDKKCNHNLIMVDEELFTVTCKDCGEKLNPVSVLVRYAKKEKNLLSELQFKETKFNNISQKIDEKQRTKCDHCGKITRVNITMKSEEWRGWVGVKPKEVK